MNIKPACWDTQENWEEWNLLNADTGSAPDRPLDHYCTDCTPGYKERMCKEGRCGYPDVTFTVVTERRRNPTTGKVMRVNTDCLRGWRNTEDENRHARCYGVRKAEANGQD